MTGGSNRRTEAGLEASTMALYVSVVLLAALIAIDEPDDVEPIRKLLVWDLGHDAGPGTCPLLRLPGLESVGTGTRIRSR